MGLKDTARTTIDKVTPGQHLTKLPGPRVLIQIPSSRWKQSAGANVPIFDASALAERLGITVPTVAVADSLSYVNLNEWDCLVTTTPPVDLSHQESEQTYRGEETKTLQEWSQRYPRHLSVLCLIRAGRFEVLDALPPEAELQEALPHVVVVRDESQVGRHLRQVEGLPEGLARVVNGELLPVARARHDHVCFRRWINPDVTEPDKVADKYELRPFMLGPDDVVLAGSYERNTESSVWILPDDLADPYPWVIEALREWHSLYPSRFPVVPDWHGMDEWRSQAEDELAVERQQLRDTFDTQRIAFEAQLDDLDQRATVAREAADGFHRALLTANGHALEDAVGETLSRFGFRVVDMDEQWPEGDRREDFRVYDDADPDWVAIVEVKGAKGGAKDTEVQNFGRWAERFILDEKRPPSARWFVTPPACNRPQCPRTALRQQVGGHHHLRQV